MLPSGSRSHVPQTSCHRLRRCGSFPSPVNSGVVLSFVHSLHQSFMVRDPRAMGAFVLAVS